LVGLLAVKILAPGFYARQDIRTPVKIAILVLCATQALNLVLVPRLGHAGLALSIGLGACLNAITLLIGLRRRNVYRPAPGWGRFLLRVIVAMAVIGLCLWWANQHIDWLGMQAQPAWRALLLLGIVGATIVVYFSVLFCLGFRMRDFRRRNPSS